MLLESCKVTRKLNNSPKRLADPQVKKDFQDIVLSARQDAFYARHMYANFGDAGAAVKGLVDEFQAASASTRNINSIEDMQVGRCCELCWRTCTCLAPHP